MFDVEAFEEGALAFTIAFFTAGVFLLVFRLIYQALTPHRERELIRAGNAAAAVTLGGAMIGYVIPLATALTQTVSLNEFAAWAALAGLIQIAVFVVVRRLRFPDLSQRIERGEMAPALYLSSISLAVGLLNAASMTA
jgi:putative membrane protein